MTSGRASSPGWTGLMVELRWAMADLHAAVGVGRAKGRPPTVLNREVRRLLDAGVSKAEAARRLGVSRQTIYRALRRAGL
jgi:DNA invertase Pin-like site-specific DNA recombinase